MKSRSEIKWLIFFGSISSLIVGLLTRFEFGDLEIQLHDSYYVLDAFSTIFYGTLTLYTLKNIYLLLELIFNRYALLALFVAIVNLLVMLFLVMVLVTAIHSMVLIDNANPGVNQSSRIVAVAFISAILLFLAAIEIKAIRKLIGVVKGEVRTT